MTGPCAPIASSSLPGVALNTVLTSSPCVAKSPAPWGPAYLGKKGWPGYGLPQELRGPSCPVPGFPQSKQNYYVITSLTSWWRPGLPRHLSHIPSHQPPPAGTLRLVLWVSLPSIPKLTLPVSQVVPSGHPELPAVPALKATLTCLCGVPSPPCLPLTVCFWRAGPCLLLRASRRGASTQLAHNESAAPEPSCPCDCPLAGGYVCFLPRLPL